MEAFFYAQILRITPIILGKEVSLHKLFLMKKHFPLLVKICLLSIYLIILAGSTVRMTGSGMGCPDWPKCFGHLIPPTSEEELQWQADTKFNKGIIIIKEESLLVAKQQFTSTSQFNAENWEAYTKHDYATFNVTHTWVEYINRLATVLSGLFFLGLIISSLFYWKERKLFPLLSFAALFFMGFEAWLGKTVVDSNLAVSKITIHMLVALLITALLLVLLHKTRTHVKLAKKDAIFNYLVYIVFGLTLIQIILGIEVREFVDEQLKNLGFQNKGSINLDAHTNFLIHRSFSILVVMLNVWLFVRNKTLNLGYSLPFWIVVVLSVEILAGVLMYYADFPFGTQVIHLLFAAILFGLQFCLILKIRRLF